MATRARRTEREQLELTLRIRRGSIFSIMACMGDDSTRWEMLRRVRADIEDLEGRLFAVSPFGAPITAQAQAAARAEAIRASWAKATDAENARNFPNG